MPTLYVDPEDIDSGDSQRNFDTQELQLWLEPDSYETGLDDTSMADVLSECSDILSLYPESPPPTQVVKDKIRRTWERLQQLLDRIKRFRGKLWSRMSEAHKAQVKAVIESLLQSAPTPPQ